MEPRCRADISKYIGLIHTTGHSIEVEGYRRVECVDSENQDTVESWHAAAAVWIFIKQRGDWSEGRCVRDHTPASESLIKQTSTKILISMEIDILKNNGARRSTVIDGVIDVPGVELDPTVVLDYLSVVYKGIKV